MTSNRFESVISTPVAKLGIHIDGSVITGLSWLSTRHITRQPQSDFAILVHQALMEYFQNGSNLPHFPLDLKGTAFQLKVWKALIDIPSGTVISYGDLAKKLNTSSRAIGQACRTNPVVLLVPCHRVVSKKGIGGYMGKQKKLNIKRWLLRHEGAL